MDISRWSVERAVFAFGGSLTALFALLALALHPDFAYGALFVGGMFVFFALTGYCPAAALFACFLSKKR